MPFGEVKDRQYCTDNAKPCARLKFIGKQLDYEMRHADHGVRMYDNTLGQFTNIDPLWEKQSRFEELNEQPRRRQQGINSGNCYISPQVAGYQTQ